jgi:hypothetical protein
MAACTAASSFNEALTLASASSFEITPACTSWAWYSSRTLGCSAMFAYIAGWL